jgi:hypothetical protein
MTALEFGGLACLIEVKAGKKEHAIAPETSM